MALWDFDCGCAQDLVCCGELFLFCIFCHQRAHSYLFTKRHMCKETNTDTRIEIGSCPSARFVGTSVMIRFVFNTNAIKKEKKRKEKSTRQKQNMKDQESKQGRENAPRVRLNAGGGKPDVAESDFEASHTVFEVSLKHRGREEWRWCNHLEPHAIARHSMARNTRGLYARRRGTSSSPTYRFLLLVRPSCCSRVTFVAFLLFLSLPNGC